MESPPIQLHPQSKSDPNKICEKWHLVALATSFDINQLGYRMGKKKKKNILKVRVIKLHWENILILFRPYGLRLQSFHLVGRPSLVDVFLVCGVELHPADTHLEPSANAIALVALELL